MIHVLKYIFYYIFFDTISNSLLYTLRIFVLILFQSGLFYNLYAQTIRDTSQLNNSRDSTLHNLNEIKIFPLNDEFRFLSQEDLSSIHIQNSRKLPSPSIFDATEIQKGFQLITPSLGFKVFNTRGFANTTNVRFSQFVDGIDNQAPHIGAPIANALGAAELDIEKTEFLPGSASSTVGANSINGLINFRTKNPFTSPGISVQQMIGLALNNTENAAKPSALFQSHFRIARILNPKLAFKMNISNTNGSDWIADNYTDLGSQLNNSTGLTSIQNPALDEVNSYGNESPNRRNLNLGGKNYMVARTGYREMEIDPYRIQNTKWDGSIYLKNPNNKHWIFTYKGANINTIYQRSNRFRLADYQLHQFSIDYHAPEIEWKTYITTENTGNSYNIRSLAENMDRAFKNDNLWFYDYSHTWQNEINNGNSVSEAHRLARIKADEGRFLPGTVEYENKKNEITQINNWDVGAALRVKANLLHTDLVLDLNKYANWLNKNQVKCYAGADYRSYFIVPDGNYFINPDSNKNILSYQKIGAFINLQKKFWQNKIQISALLRGEKSDYFKWKIAPRIVVAFIPQKQHLIRLAYFNGYRFPSIFEGFSNVNSGGVKRVGGLKIMSNGIFENSYLQSSVNAFQMQVNQDINNLNLTTNQAIEKNKNILKKNTYTYLNPETVRTFEFGYQGQWLNRRIVIDIDLYYNIFQHFIAQVEASIPNTSYSDSTPYFLFSKNSYSRYRLWTNSKSKIFTYGGNFGLRFKVNKTFYILSNATWSQLGKTDNGDGLEDGFNSPAWIYNSTLLADNYIPRMNSSVTVRYQSQFQYISFLVNGIVPPFWAWDTQWTYTFRKPELMIKIGATNLLNRPYYNMLGGPTIKGFYYLTMTLQIK